MTTQIKQKLFRLWAERRNKLIKSALKIENANCESCAYLGSDGDGPEYNGNWDICDKIDRFNNLKTFPFKKEMPCWWPNFWWSKFSEMITKGTEAEARCLSYEFRKTINESLSKIKTLMLKDGINQEEIEGVIND